MPIISVSAWGKWVWKSWAFPRLKFFVRLCLNNSIVWAKKPLAQQAFSVREVLIARGLIAATLCPRFQGVAWVLNLTILPLRDCFESKTFRNCLGIQGFCNASFGLTLADWLRLCSVRLRTSNLTFCWIFFTENVLKYT